MESYVSGILLISGGLSDGDLVVTEGVQKLRPGQKVRPIDSQFVKEAKIYEKSGAILTYTIVKFTPNSAISENMFVFDSKKYSGVEVIDLR